VAPHSGGDDSLSGYGQVFFRNVLVSGVLPQIAIILALAPAAQLIHPPSWISSSWSKERPTCSFAALT
jgi:hypothetical protein